MKFVWTRTVKLILATIWDWYHFNLCLTIQYLFFSLDLVP